MPDYDENLDLDVTMNNAQAKVEVCVKVDPMERTTCMCQL